MYLREVLKMRMDNIKGVFKSKRNIAIALLFLVAVTSLGVYAVNSKGASKDVKISKKTEQKSKDKKAEDKKSEDELKAEKELAEAKKSGDSEAIKKAEAKVKAVATSNTKSTSSTSSTSSKPVSSNSSSSSSSSKQTEKPKQKVLVKEAWTEARQVAVTKYRPTWWIKKGGVFTIYYSEEEMMAASSNLDDSGIPHSWGNGEDEAYTVYETEYINHPAEYEYR